MSYFYQILIRYLRHSCLSRFYVLATYLLCTEFLFKRHVFLQWYVLSYCHGNFLLLKSYRLNITKPISGKFNITKKKSEKSKHFLHDCSFFLQKVFVMPNMDDVYIPIMHSAMDPRSTSCLLKDPLVETADQL